MIDLHSHVLSGIDDGPETIEGSIEIARAAAAAGTRILLATPHVSRRYPNTADAILELTDELNARLAQEQIELEVKTGAEIAMTRLVDVQSTELPRLALGDGGWLLVEPPFSPTATGVDVVLLELQRRGHRIVIAHPERCPAFHRDPDLVRSLVRAGLVTSLTAGSLVGRFGDRVRKFALTLVHDELVHNVASDAHDCERRPPSVVAELQQAGLEPLTEWLVEQVPAALLAGREIPARPSVALSGPESGGLRRWWRRAG